MWVAYHPLPDWRTGGLPSSLMPESVCFPKGRMCGGVFLQEGQVRFFPPYRSVANQSVVCRCIWRLWTMHFFQMQSVEHYIWMPLPDDSSSSFFFSWKKGIQACIWFWGNPPSPNGLIQARKRAFAIWWSHLLHAFHVPVGLRSSGLQSAGIPSLFQLWERPQL